MSVISALPQQLAASCPSTSCSLWQISVLLRAHKERTYHPHFSSSSAHPSLSVSLGLNAPIYPPRHRPTSPSPHRSVCRHSWDPWSWPRDAGSRLRRWGHEGVGGGRGCQCVGGEGCRFGRRCGIGPVKGDYSRGDWHWLGLVRGEERTLSRSNIRDWGTDIVHQVWGMVIDEVLESS